MRLMQKFPSRLFAYTLIGIFLLEICSYFGYLAQPLNQIGFVLACIVVVVLTIRKLEYGVYCILAELVIGSKGYLLSWPIGDFKISIRLAVFLIVMAIWAVHAVRTRAWNSFHHSEYIRPFLGLLLILVLAAINGIASGNSAQLVFLDANGYLFFGAFFIILEVIRGDRVFAALTVFLAALSASIIKTFFLLFIFSHQISPFFGLLYRWVRVTGVGEITELSSGFYRIFFQSHIYEVFLYFCLLAVLLMYSRKQLGRVYWSITARWILAGSVIILSLSRSFWLGMIVGLGVLLAVIIFSLRWKFKLIAGAGLFIIVGSLLQVALLTAVIRFPLPHFSSSISVGSLVEERTSDITGEAAGASRFALLKPLFSKILERPIEGSGFGTTVSYASQDARALQASNGGLYTTYAFEWGYLDLWLKLGLIGSLAYAWFIVVILKKGWTLWQRKKEGDELTTTLVLGLGISTIVLLTIHATTPYLNHPLGIGWLLFVAAIFQHLEDTARDSHKIQ